MADKQNKNADRGDENKKGKKQQPKDMMFEPGIILGTAKQYLGDIAEHLPEQYNFVLLEKAQQLMDTIFGPELGKLLVTGGVGALSPLVKRMLNLAQVPEGVQWTLLETYDEFFDGIRRAHREKGKLSQVDLNRVYDASLANFKKRMVEETSFHQMAQMLPFEKQIELRRKEKAYCGDDTFKAMKFAWWRRQIKTPRMLEALLLLEAGEWEEHLTHVLGEPPVKKPGTATTSRIAKGLQGAGAFLERNLKSLVGIGEPSDEVKDVRQRVDAFTERQKAATKAAGKRSRAAWRAFRR